MYCLSKCLLTVTHAQARRLSVSILPFEISFMKISEVVISGDRCVMQAVTQINSSFCTKQQSKKDSFNDHLRVCDGSHSATRAKNMTCVSFFPKTEFQSLKLILSTGYKMCISCASFWSQPKHRISMRSVRKKLVHLGLALRA